MAIGAVYGGRDFALWRWRPSPVDDVVIAFVRAATSMSSGELAALRDGLGMEDFYTLSFFARRWALRALRGNDSAGVREAFDALSIIDTDRMDSRDFSPAFASVVSRRMGLQPMAVAADAIGRATPTAAGTIAEYASNEAYARDTAALVRLVDTEDGTVVVDGHGFSTLPADQDLIADMLAIADAVEDEGTYVVSAVSVAPALPAWFVRATASSAEMAAVTRLSGCVHLAGTLASPNRRRTENNQLWIWHTQAATDDDAALLAAAANWNDRGTVCLSTRTMRLLTVIMARNVWRGARSIEDSASLARMIPIARSYGARNDGIAEVPPAMHASIDEPPTL